MVQETFQLHSLPSPHPWKEEIPPQLIMTLEHIVGQLDVHTQVSCGKFLNRELFQRPRALGVGMGMGNSLLLVTPSRCHSQGRIPVVWKHYSCSFSLSPSSPQEKEYLIARWGSFLKQQLAIRSVAPVGKKVMNSLIRAFCCTETRQRFRATRRCISLRLN